MNPDLPHAHRNMLTQLPHRERAGQTHAEYSDLSISYAKKIQHPLLRGERLQMEQQSDFWPRV